MDMLNTLCGAYPVRWIGKNSHDKVIQVTPELKGRIIEICEKYAEDSPSLSPVEDFFKDQPDNILISFLREGILLQMTEKRTADAQVKALVANYRAEFRDEKNIDTTFHTLICLTSDGGSFSYKLPNNFPDDRKEKLTELLHVATDLSQPSMFDGDQFFWKLSELRCFAKSQVVETSIVGGFIRSQVNRLKNLDDSAVVVFGILDGADMTFLCDLKLACYRTKVDGSQKPYYELRMAHDRLLELGGYKRRSFTDLGFSYRIQGKNVCRFCGRGPKDPDGVRFRKEPHAISYFWGNHSLLGAGECDSCNEFFGKTLEPMAQRYYSPTMIKSGVTGRGGNPMVEGENFTMKLGHTQILMDSNDGDLFERLSRGEEVRRDLIDSQPVVKSDIYRCFCKYVVSLINDEELPAFKDTIEWITKKRRSSINLPVTLRNEVDLDLVDTPTIDIYTSTGKPYKSYIIGFRFITNLWLFAVPYVSGCNNSKLTKEIREFQKSFYPDLKFKSESFANEDKTLTVTHVKISASSEPKFTRFGDMTPEEQEEFIKRQPKRWNKHNHYKKK